jgi:hypothetical protein
MDALRRISGMTWTLTIVKNRNTVYNRLSELSQLYLRIYTIFEDGQII